MIPARLQSDRLVRLDRNGLGNAFQREFVSGDSDGVQIGVFRGETGVALGQKDRALMKVYSEGNHTGHKKQQQPGGVQTDDPPIQFPASLAATFRMQERTATGNCQWNGSRCDCSQKLTTALKSDEHETSACWVCRITDSC